MEQPRRSGGGAGALIAVVVILIAAVAGAGGWWWYQKQHGPAAALDKLVQAQKAKDWKAVYEGIEWPAIVKQFLTEDMFIQAAGQGNGATLKDYKIGAVTTNGDTATVNISSTADVRGTTKSTTADIAMLKVNGVWKVDLNKMINDSGGLAALSALGQSGGGSGGFGGFRGAPNASGN